MAQIAVGTASRGALAPRRNAVRLGRIKPKRCTVRLVRASGAAGAEGGERTPEPPSSRRAILKGTLQLLAASGMLGSAQVRGAGLHGRRPPLPPPPLPVQASAQLVALPSAILPHPTHHNVIPSAAGCRGRGSGSRRRGRCGGCRRRLGCHGPGTACPGRRGGGRRCGSRRTVRQQQGG